MSERTRAGCSREILIYLFAIAAAGIVILKILKIIYEILRFIFLAIVCILAAGIALLLLILLLAMMCDGLAMFIRYLRARARFYRNVRGSSWPFHHLLTDPRSASGYLWTAIDYWLGVKTVRAQEKSCPFGLKQEIHQARQNAKIMALQELRHRLLEDEDFFRSWFHEQGHVFEILRPRGPADHIVLRLYARIWNRFRQEARDPHSASELLHILAGKIASERRREAFLFTKTTIYVLSWRNFFPPEDSNALVVATRRKIAVEDLLLSAVDFNRYLDRGILFELFNELSQDYAFDFSEEVHTVRKAQARDGHFVTLPLVATPERTVRSIAPPAKRLAASKVVEVRVRQTPATPPPGETREEIERFRAAAIAKHRQARFERRRDEYMCGRTAGQIFLAFRSGGECEFNDAIRIVAQAATESTNVERVLNELKQNRDAFLSFWETNENKIYEIQAEISSNCQARETAAAKTRATLEREAARRTQSVENRLERIKAIRMKEDAAIKARQRILADPVYGLVMATAWNEAQQLFQRHEIPLIDERVFERILRGLLEQENAKQRFFSPTAERAIEEANGFRTGNLQHGEFIQKWYGLSPDGDLSEIVVAFAERGATWQKAYDRLKEKT